MQQLRQTGTRAIAIAVVGSVLPICAGVAIIYLVKLEDEPEFKMKTALGVGFSFAPTSLGVASSALSSGGVSNTPVGQLIMAACVLTDIIGLVLLSMFEVLVKDDPKLIEYFIPIISSFGLLIVCGAVAIFFLSGWIENMLPKIPKRNRDITMFIGAFAMCMGYLPMMHYTNASYLAGAFLVGFTFSLVEGAHEKFLHSTHSVMEWLLKIFFAATIGFQVPIKLLFEKDVILLGSLFWVTCVLVKLLVAFFVPNFVSSHQAFNPYTRDLLTTGLSMTCRGELNFIIAAFALDKGVIKPKMYAAIVFAVLLSAITSPFALLKSLNYFNDLHEKYLKSTNPLTKANSTMPLHIHLYLETQNAWSLSDRLQTALSSNLGLSIEDYRTGHNGNRSNPTITSNIYVSDPEVTVHLPNIQEQKELQRLETIISNHTPGYEYLWDAENVDSLTKSQQEEVELISKKKKEIEAIITRLTALEDALRDALRGVEIEDITASQWEPWDWNVVLDTLSLHRPNGTEFTVDFLMKMFETADVDENGELDIDEFCEALQNGGVEISTEDLAALVAVVDQNSDGLISRDEWEQAITHYMELKHKKLGVSTKSQVNGEKEYFLDA